MACVDVMAASGTARGMLVRRNTFHLALTVRAGAETCGSSTQSPDDSELHLRMVLQMGATPRKT